MTKIIKGDLVLKENTVFEEDLIVEGNIRCENGLWDLNCRDLNCIDLDCWNLSCRNLDCRDLNCIDLDCWNLSCRNLDCRDLSCWNLNFYAVAVAYNSFKCKSWKARRENYVIKCLDGEIEIKDKPKVCEKCGQEIKDE